MLGMTRGERSAWKGLENHARDIGQCPLDKDEGPIKAGF